VTIETRAGDRLERDCFAPRSFCPYNADMAISASSRSQVRLLGVPWDANSSFLRGPAQAPGKIRESLQCDASNSWSETGIDTAVRDIFGDAGDVEFGSGGDWFAQTETKAGKLAAECKPLFLGGDHSVTYPLVSGMSRKWPKLTVIHFDAHPDLYEEFGNNRYSHASPFARILEEKLAARLIQVGIRTMNAHQREQASKYDVEVYRMGNEVNFAEMEITGPVYVTVDLDALDPAYAPGVSHREPGGMSVRELIGYLHAIPGHVVGADLVEFNPERDMDGMTATVCAKLVKELVGVMVR
jgi:arginase